MQSFLRLALLTIAAAGLAAATSLATAQHNAPKAAPSSPDSPPGAAPAAPPPASTAPAAPAAPQQAALEYVLMTTGKGPIVLELNRAKAPISVENFLKYTDKQFYDGTVFHRIIGTFMIQGGGFDATMTQKPTDAPIKNEWRNGLMNTRGTIAMARLGGNPDSATSQFFINVANHGMLDRPQGDGASYAVFGKVVAGMDVVDAIKSVPVTADSRGERSKPVTPVVIESVKRISAEEAHKLTSGAANKPG
jgi:peptidyl-prolyl cis-trans isomerase A (cyclophilin A)